MTSDETSVRADLRQGSTHPNVPGGARIRCGLAAIPPAPDSLLAVIEYGPTPERQVAAPLGVKVRLEPLDSVSTAEYWSAQGQVVTGHAGQIRYAHDDHFLFAVIEVDERDDGGILPATQAVYTAIREFQKTSQFPHLLRIWNFMDAVNEGDGDFERYRQFCVGRARGFTEASEDRYPAATAIGRQHPSHELQVFWLAGRRPGTAIENPRQVSAYRYPRAHGPASPSFSRATVTSDGMLLISGTASIVGHLSKHPGNPLAQLEEILRNLTVLVERARQDGRVGASREPMLLKVYVRDPAHVASIAARLRTAFPNDPAIFLAADICRRELLLEIECVVQG
jgi:chorismate lyase/3-hydroxybenzoate synthase